MRKPFFWKARGAGYVKAANHRSNIFLDADETKAYEIWGEMVAKENNAGPNALAVAIIDEYLGHLERTISPAEYKRRGYYLKLFATACGVKRVKDVIPLDLTKWSESVPSWGPSSQRAGIGEAKKAFKWAKEQGLLKDNPFADVRKPAGKRRETMVSDGDHEKLLAWQSKARGGKLGSYTKRDSAFRHVVLALRHSGGRPGTVCAVNVEDVSPDFATWTLKEHKTKNKTGRPLPVYLSPCLQTLTRLLVGKRTKGPLFRNSRGQRWTPNAIRCRMRRMKIRLDLPEGTVAYSYRHTFITEAIVRGVDLTTVAELVGHKDASMIVKHYGHLAGKRDHLKEAVAKAMKKSAS